MLATKWPYPTFFWKTTGSMLCKLTKVVMLSNKNEEEKICAESNPGLGLETSRIT